MATTRKFSQFQGPSQIESTDIVVGLRNGQNWQFTGVGSGSGGGVTVIIDQVSHGLSLGNWVRIDTLGDYVKAQATTAQNSEVVGCVVDVESADEFTLQVVGFVDEGVFAGLTPGGVYFLSGTTLGEMTLVEPTTTSYVSLPVFIAATATTGYVRQSRGVIIGGFPPLGNPDDGAPVIHTVTQPGNTFAVGDWVRISGAGVYDLADGTSFTNALAIGVVINVNGDDFSIQQAGWNSGVVSMDDMGNPLTAAAPYYISATVPGAITETAPSTIGQGVRPVFISEDPATESGWIFPVFPETVGSGSNSTNIIPVNQVAHGFTQGDVVRVSALSTYALAQGDSATNALPVGFVVEVVDADNFILQTSGYSTAFGAPFTPLVPASRYFLSPTVAGGITNTEPTTAGQYSVPMLIALTTTSGFILEQRPLAVTGGGAIRQVVYTTSNVANSGLFFTNLWQDVFFCNLDITPTSVASVVRIMINTIICTASALDVGFRIVRNGVAIPSLLSSGPTSNPSLENFTFTGACLSGGGGGGTPSYCPVSVMAIDTPATNVLTNYKLQIIGKINTGAGGQWFVNERNASPNFQGITTMTLEEIG